VLAGMLVHPFAGMHETIRRYEQALAQAPDELNCWAVLRKAPPLPFLPEKWHGKEVVVLALCYVGDIVQGEAAARPFRAIGKPIADVVGPMPFVDWQAAFDPLLTPGARNYWKSHDVASFSDEALEIIGAAIEGLPTEETEIFFGHMGGAMTRVPSDATAWPNRKAHYAVNMHTRWRDPRDDERCRNWARGLHRALEPHAMGSVYVNFMPEGDDDRIAAAYGPNLEKLTKIKRRVDPDNLFRANLNIAPAA
jgi:FAD/FMN-containing dehydrogenase